MLSPLRTTRSFPALHNPHFRLYWLTAGVAMAADNVEHVIGYWIIWELTHNPFWLGYAVVSHWLPFILLSVFAGAVSDRIDNRWLIQFSQGLYMFGSLAWGVLYLTGQLQIWHIALLLILHGLAGVIIGPSSYLLIHKMVSQDQMVSAISLNASQRHVASLLGPLMGGALIATVGPGWGFVVNVLIHFPLVVAMLRLPYGRPSGSPTSSMGWGEAIEGLRFVRRDRLIVGLLLTVGTTSFFMGNAYQALMPAFAELLHVQATGYSLLLAANGLGAIIGVLGLGLLGVRHLRPVVVTLSAIAWALLLVLFAVSRWYPFSLAVLLGNGMLNIVYVSMAQTIIQSWSPAEVRGRVIGVFSTVSNGLRVGSGFMVAALASVVGPALTLVINGLVVAALVIAIASLVPVLWLRRWEPIPVDGPRIARRS